MATLALEDMVATTRRKVMSRGEALELLGELDESGQAASTLVSATCGPSVKALGIRRRG